MQSSFGLLQFIGRKCVIYHAACIYHRTETHAVSSEYHSSGLAVRPLSTRLTAHVSHISYDSCAHAGPCVCCYMLMMM